MAAAWDGMSGWYKMHMSAGTSSVAISLYGHLGMLTPGARTLRVLETHCGDAFAASNVLPLPAVASYTATDFSESMLSAARANLGELATCVVSESTSLPFADASFDRYLSNLGICCTSDVDAKLSEAHRVLAPGGVAAMSTRIDGDEGDTSFELMRKTLASFGMLPPPDREGPRLGRDLAALRARVTAAGFSGAVAWRTYATLPIHDAAGFTEWVITQPGAHKFLSSLDAATKEEAVRALDLAGTDALSKGAIQIAVAVVVAKR